MEIMAPLNSDSCPALLISGHRRIHSCQRLLHQFFQHRFNLPNRLRSCLIVKP